jgi:hypothetical protein
VLPQFARFRKSLSYFDLLVVYRPNVVSLLNSADPEVQEHAAATLRNIMSE